MSKIKKITSNQIKLLKKFISIEKKEFNYFDKIGWSEKNIYNYIQKKNNASIAYYEDDELTGFLLGEFIKEEEYFNLEVYIIYVSQGKRREKIGTKLLNHFIFNKKTLNISKIYLEVSAENISAIKFYERNNFVFLNFRHNYYKYNNKLVNAMCYMKKI